MSALVFEELLADFSQAEAGHPHVLAQVQAHVEAPDLEGLPFEKLLARFALSEKHRAILLADGGWSADLVVFLGHALQRIDPSLRAAFPGVNAVLEGLAAGVPGGGIAVHVLLAVAEGPLLSLVEAWLLARANSIEKRRAAAG